jgi:hypothetical protein
MSTNDQEPTDERYSSTYQRKLIVHERDQNTCLCCGEVFEDTSHLDVDHNVPRGRGGPNTISNKMTLCRRCHEAKHGERDHAPTVRFISTGDMIEKDFSWYRHLWTEQLPALTEVVLKDRIVPKFALSENEAWHIPIGDLRRLDKVLAEKDRISYAPREAHHYMR